MTWLGHVACMGDSRDACRVLVGKPEGKRPLGRTSCRWEDSIRWILHKWDGEACTGLNWLRIGTGGGRL